MELIIILAVQAAAMVGACWWGGVLGERDSRKAGFGKGEG